MPWHLLFATSICIHGATKLPQSDLKWPRKTIQRADVQTKCNVTSFQGPPSAVTRRNTASNILTILSGKSLKDRELDGRIRSSMHALDNPKIDTRIWDRLAVNVLRSGPAAISRALDQTMYPVPNVSGAQDQRCQLTSYPFGRRFKDDTQLNILMADLFEGIAKGVLAASLPPVELTRWDLFHAHIFFTPQDRGVGLLFHAKEYPKQCDAFPYNLGYCQQGSPLDYHEREMDFRNLLYFQGELCCLDVGEASVLHNTLIMDGLQDVRTVLESDFGDAIGDVNYFGSLEAAAREDKLFVCGNFSNAGEAERT